MSKLIFILLWMTPLLCNGQEWSSPYFTDPNVDGVNYGVLNGDTREVDMDEELSVPITVAHIAYQGTEEPKITAFGVGSSFELGADLNEVDGRWDVVITKFQDYETITSPTYRFHITIGTVTARIHLRITNLFDTDPSVTYDGPCKFKEENEPGFILPDCIFTVTDLDGIAFNDITWEIEGSSSNEDTLFGLKHMEDDDTLYTQSYQLEVLTTLYYVDSPFYNFRINVYDIARNDGSIIAIVELEDIPNMPPRWIKPFTMARFDEKTKQNFEIEATDGDTGINYPIEYELQWLAEGDYSDIISLRQVSGNVYSIDVEEIDRDTRVQEIFNFVINAYKIFDGVKFESPNNALIIINDINDNPPAITLEPVIIEFLENTYLTLDFTRFIINDVDLGDHATYNVILSEETTTGIAYSEAFNIIPNSGYQLAEFFKINVINAALVDYEDSLWRTFTLKIIAEEALHKSEKTFEVRLINWNDEIPTFLNGGNYEAYVTEMIGSDQFIETVKAKDRDIGDVVSHNITGSMGRYLSIDPVSGDIKTLQDGVFNYETQPEVVVQVEAIDSLGSGPYHKVFAQLTIKVRDENDETPSIVMPRESLAIDENSPGGTVVTTDIVAQDLDTTADLFFEIDWENSYATKSGNDAEKELYQDCFIIEKVEETINLVHGHVKINPDFPLLVDYEEYEIIFLSIRVTDLNQKYNEASSEATLTVRIIDLNDNPPEFSDNTLTVERNVLEEAPVGTQIGSIFATDRDGPLHNKITYAIKPINDEPEHWVQIDQKGIITVGAGDPIDCDVPPREAIECQVILTDEVHTTVGRINILIIDTNNKEPVAGDFDKVKYIKEKVSSSGDLIVDIIATDLDRDAPHNVLAYYIDYSLFPNLERFFAVDESTGSLTIQLQGTNVLDYDTGDKEHSVNVMIEDNVGERGAKYQIQVTVTVHLIDVNDHAPQFDPNLLLTISEDSALRQRFSNDICAEDLDSDLNGQVRYEILSVEAAGNNHLPVPENNLELEITDVANCGRLTNVHTLEKYYGDWAVKIKASDMGEDDIDFGVQSSEFTYIINILPFNFNPPIIIFPTTPTIRLLYQLINAGRDLRTVDGELLRYFEATDPDGGIYGMIQFEVLENDSDAEYFEFKHVDDKKSELALIKEVTAGQTLQITVRAIDGGDKLVLMPLTLTFIDMDADPYFEELTWFDFMSENTVGLSEHLIIPEALDPIQLNSDDENELYYYIDQAYNSESVKYFDLEKDTRKLTLKTILDREEFEEHEIQIIVSRSAEGPPTRISVGSVLKATIIVLDINDNPPVFRRENYGSGITTSDYLTKPLITLQADDVDLNETITYHMVDGSMVLTDESLESVRDTAFRLDTITGVISLQFVPIQSMSGYFRFQVEARDNDALHSAQATVQIFIVAESNRVSFLFLNPTDTIKENEDFITRTFETHYGYECIADDVEDYTVDGVIQPGVTRLRTHFTLSNEAILADVIRSRSSDVFFITNLKTELFTRTLNLQDVPAGDLTTENDKANTLQTVLIVIAALFGTLCVVLIVTFFIKMRQMQRQLKAMTLTDPQFGSTSSELNRRQGPMSNVYSVEGTNPTLANLDINRGGAYDSMSVLSEESDEFGGIENDPTFKTKNNVNPLVNGNGNVNERF